MLFFTTPRCGRLHSRPGLCVLKTSTEPVWLRAWARFACAVRISSYRCTLKHSALTASGIVSTASARLLLYAGLASHVSYVRAEPREAAVEWPLNYCPVCGLAQSFVRGPIAFSRKARPQFLRAAFAASDASWASAMTCSQPPFTSMALVTMSEQSASLAT